MYHNKTGLMYDVAINSYTICIICSNGVYSWLTGLARWRERIWPHPSFMLVRGPPVVMITSCIFTNTLEQLVMFSIGHTSEYTVRNTSGILISTFSCRCATEGCCQEGIRGLTKPTVAVATRRDSGVRTTRMGEASACP